MACETVRRVRIARQLTMAGLADLAQVPTSTISRIEAGKIDPTVAMLARITQAAGYRYEPSVVEAGFDQPFADILDRLESADAAGRARLFDRFAAAAVTAPVTRRTGMRRAAVPGDLASAVSILQQQSQHPVVSGMEAVAEQVNPALSFVPLVYVDNPAQVTGFGQSGRDAFQAMLLLPTTGNVRRFTRATTEVPMMVREWGWLDAMASPGRQGDIAREEFESMRMVAA